MNRNLIACALGACLLVSGAACAADNPNIPSGGVVRNAVTATKIAAAVLVNFVGEHSLMNQMPLTAQLVNGVWHVDGTLEIEKYEFGQRLHVEIGEIDGRILALRAGP